MVCVVILISIPVNHLTAHMSGEGCKSFASAFPDFLVAGYRNVSPLRW